VSSSWSLILQLLEKGIPAGNWNFSVALAEIHILLLPETTKIGRKKQQQQQQHV